jgi:hypothetical protein
LQTPPAASTPPPTGSSPTWRVQYIEPLTSQYGVWMCALRNSGVAAVIALRAGFL